MSYEPTLADVAAAGDVLDDIAKIADALPPERAVEFRIAVDNLRKRAVATIQILNQELLRLLDGQPAIVRSGQKFYVGPKTEKEIYDHDEIARRVADYIVGRAVNQETGEIEMTYSQLALEVALAMKQVYCSDSTKAKKTVLDQFKIRRNANMSGSVLEVLRGLKEVKSIPAPGEPDT